MSIKLLASTSICLLITAEPLFAAGGITPDYYMHYDCKTIQTESLKEEHEIDWRTGAEQRYPKLLSHDVDKIVVVWNESETDTENQGSPRIYLQSLDNKGNRLWADFGMAPTDSLLSLELSGLAADGKNGLLVSWLETQHFDACIRNNRLQPALRMQNFDDKGKKLWGKKGKVIPLHKDSDISSAIMTTDGHGGAYISLLDKFHEKVIVHKLDSNGNKVWGEEGLQFKPPATIEDTISNVNSTKKLTVPTWDKIKRFWLEADMQGGFYLVWDNAGLLLAQKASGKGSKLWQSPVFIGFTEKFKRGKILVDDDDDLIFIHTPASKYGKNINITKTDKSGKVEYPYINSSETEEQWLGDALLANNGDVVIFWLEKLPDGDNKYKLYVERIHNERSRVWNKSPITAYSHAVHNARLLHVGETDFAIVWDDNIPHQGNKNTLSYINKKLYAQGITGAGKLVKPKPTVIYDGKILHAGSPIAAVSDKKGGIFISWSDARRTFSSSIKQDPEYAQEMTDIYVQYINANIEPQWEKNGIPVSTLISNKHGGDVFIFKPYIE